MLYLLFYSSGAAWLSFYNIYLRQIGFSGLQIGSLASIRPAALLLSQPVWGIAADMWGRRRTLLLAMGLAAVLVLGYATGRTFQFFVLWTILYNVIANPAGALIDSLVLDHVEKRSNLSFGRLRLWGGVGWGAASLATGLLITGRDMRLIFVLSAALMLAGFMVAYRSTQGDAASATTTKRSWSGLGQVLRNRRLIVFLLLVTLLQTAASSIFTFYTVYLDDLGASNRQIGLALTLQGLGELPLYLTGAAIMRRFGTSRTWIFAALVFAARALLYSVLERPVFAMLVELSHGLSFALFLVASVDYVDRLVPSTWRATGQSLLTAAYFGAGPILGNPWAGWLLDRFGSHTMFRVNGLLLLLVAGIAVVALRGSEQEPWSAAA